MMNKKMKKGQIWIETVLYTLIGLALIGTILAFAIPKITSAQERILIQQTIQSLKVLDQLITNVIESGPDNVRSYELTFKRGDFYIDGENDTIFFTISDLKKLYSEKDVIINDGRVEIKSFESGKSSAVSLTLNYSLYANITFQNMDKTEKITPSPVAYRFLVSHLPPENGSKPIINIRRP